MHASTTGFRLGLCALGVVLLVGCNRPAPTSAAEKSAAGDRTAHAQQVSTNSDASLAAEDFFDKTMGADIYQIQASKIVQAKGRAPDVKAFAQSMAEEHATSRVLLEDAARQSGQSIPIPTAPTDQQQSMLNLLDRGEPQDFDRTYMEQQVQLHEDTLSVVAAYAQSGAVPAIRAVAAGLEPDLRQDLKKAQMLESALDKP